MKNYLDQYLQGQAKNISTHLERGTDKTDKTSDVDSFVSFVSDQPYEYEKKSHPAEKRLVSQLPTSGLQFLKADCPELQSVATLLRCPECGSRLHQLTHPLDETDHYMACERCDYRAVTPTVLRGFCYGDDCKEELNYINGQAYCKRHRMTVTLIEQTQ